jgi:hypothetical protein
MKLFSDIRLIMEIFEGFLAFLIGGLAAIAELLSRYKSLSRILSVGASWVYLIINGFASIMAFVIVVQFDIAKDHAIFQILIAGSSAMIILRSSVANIKIGDKNAEIGIAAILQVFLHTADRAFDQKRSDYELGEIKEIMDGVNFDRAKLDLPTTCFTVMKNVPEDEQKRISKEVSKLSSGDLDSKTKSLNLGIILAGMTGIPLLKKVVAVHKPAIMIEGGDVTPSEKLDEILNKLSK